MEQAPAFTDNRILAALGRDDMARLRPHLTPCQLAQGEVLYEPESVPRHVYFPASAVVSLTYTTRNGSSAEASLIGNRGVVGMALFYGGDTTPYRALVQTPGGAFRMNPSVLVEEVARGGALCRLLLRYTQALLTMSTQAAVCNRLHPLDQRLCRWLLLICDRAGCEELTLTQEAMAQSLGVRREAVTKTAGHLQRSGAISYNRGSLTVLDREKLEALSCECYEVVRAEYERLIG
jgi:CRP-like cAMP-binding protein